MSRFPHLLRSSLRSLSTATTTQPIRHPSHPNNLYFHKIDSQDFALSFLPTLHDPESVTVIGYMPEASLDKVWKFQEAKEWRELVHMILAGRVHESLMLDTMAKTRPEDGYLHIVDERNIPFVNRAGEPEDIIASVLTQDRKIVPGSYEPGPAYRVITRDGLMQLNSELHKYLVDGLKVAQQLEQEDVD